MGLGQKVKTLFSNRGHVAYQIKGKEVQTKIDAKTLTLLTPLVSGSGCLADIEIVQLNTHTLVPWGENVVMLHSKLKGKKYRPKIEAKTLTLHTPLVSGSACVADIEIVQISTHTLVPWGRIKRSKLCFL